MERNLGILQMSVLKLVLKFVERLVKLVAKAHEAATLVFGHVWRLFLQLVVGMPLIKDPEGVIPEKLEIGEGL
jgi:hypothetical protein